MKPFISSLKAQSSHCVSISGAALSFSHGLLGSGRSLALVGQHGPSWLL